jgi:hypothetical protein
MVRLDYLPQQSLGPNHRLPWRQYFPAHPIPFCLAVFPSLRLQSFLAPADLPQQSLRAFLVKERQLIKLKEIIELAVGLICLRFLKAIK